MVSEVTTSSSFLSFISADDDDAKRRVATLLEGFGYSVVQAGVIVTDYSTVAVEMLKENASPKAGPLYGALDMPFAGLIGRLAGAFGKGR
jgi:predicted dinucleotide-binding enzyme